MYKCNNCGNIIESDDDFRQEHTTYESLYGVSSDFPDSHSLTIYSCPYCGSEDYDEYRPPLRYETDEELVSAIIEMFDFNEEQAATLKSDVEKSNYKKYIDLLRDTFDIDEEDVKAALIYMGDLEDEE